MDLLYFYKELSQRYAKQISLVDDVTTIETITNGLTDYVTFASSIAKNGNTITDSQAREMFIGFDNYCDSLKITKGK